MDTTTLGQSEPGNNDNEGVTELQNFLQHAKK